jgi:hypothetical protein
MGAILRNGNKTIAGDIALFMMGLGFAPVPTAAVNFSTMGNTSTPPLGHTPTREHATPIIAGIPKTQGTLESD